ncbi:MAG: ATP-binding protein [Bacteroidales bacterium]
MTYIERQISDKLLADIEPNKVVLLTGARRTGKTWLMKQITKQIEGKLLELNGEDMSDQELFEPRSKEHYKLIFGKYDYVFVDEAQKIADVGSKLKFLVDNIDNIKVMATGSSAFDISRQFGEPLTGRKKTWHLYPFSVQEFMNQENIRETQGKLPERLIYGCYPELVNMQTMQQKEDYLYELADDYLFKDILTFDGIKNSDKIRNLLRLIAFQVGNEVSNSELANKLQVHKDTVSRYLDLLSKVFIIFKVEGFSQNLRKEITKMHRWYFYDNGIRNLLIKNFNPLELRNDQGQLWENYMIAERVKYQSYNRLHTSNYFWRTYDKQEIDWIEQSGGKLKAYEMKWNPKKTVKPPSSWQKAYPEASFDVIHPKNYLTWLSNQ